MNFSLKPRVFLIGFLPGFLFILAFLILSNDYDLDAVKEFAESISLFSGIAIVILSFIIGQIFDSFRDFFIEGLIFEWLFKWFSKRKPYSKYLKNGDINWDFFYVASEKQIDKLDNNYYLFYVVNINLAICLVVILVLILFNWHKKIPHDFIINKLWLIISISISVFLLAFDALVLRNDIAKITRTKKPINDTEEKNVAS